ncbi:hypothetical protein B0T09DRAFT_349813 [Sordaria sp. MPI-SDFR-AT-0083]|nr:hypothetical protein B0T09DRAFT_349813 [Sordaria sp. MPI-SDFR-AT-0083]
MIKHGFRRASTLECVRWFTIITLTLTCQPLPANIKLQIAPSVVALLGWPTHLALSIGQISDVYWASSVSRRRGHTVGANGCPETGIPKQKC